MELAQYRKYHCDGAFDQRTSRICAFPLVIQQQNVRFALMSVCTPFAACFFPKGEPDGQPFRCACLCRRWSTGRMQGTVPMQAGNLTGIQSKESVDQKLGKPHSIV